ncbi:MAG TPA: hypothetical protein VFS21_09835 [Roseiflexaceae bacterium]|nr:hypothetical protein [Roseiflexaceae bacterium]
MSTRIDTRWALALLVVLLGAGAGIWWALSGQGRGAGELRQVYTFSFAGPQTLATLTERGLERFSWPDLRRIGASPRPAPPPAEWSTTTLKIVGGAHAWSADGTWLAFQHDDDVEIWRTDGTAPTAVLPGVGHDLVRMGLSADGRALVTDQSDPALAVRRWQLGPGAAEPAAPLTDKGALLALSPDGALAAAYTADGITLIGIQSGAAARSIPLPVRARVDTAAFSADGALLAAAGVMQSPEIWVWRVSDGALLHTLRGYGDTVAALAFSPDRAQIAAGGGHDEAIARTDTSVRVWRLSDSSSASFGSTPLPGLPPAATVSRIAFSPDGSALVVLTSDGMLRFWPTPSL